MNSTLDHEFSVEHKDSGAIEIILTATGNNGKEFKENLYSVVRIDEKTTRESSNIAWDVERAKAKMLSAAEDLLKTVDESVYV